MQFTKFRIVKHEHGSLGHSYVACDHGDAVVWTDDPKKAEHHVGLHSMSRKFSNAVFTLAQDSTARVSVQGWDEERGYWSMDQ